MTLRESTAQQTDPLGALNSRPITLVLAACAVVLAAVRTTVSRGEIVDARLAIAAVLLIAVAAATIAAASSPFRAPFTRNRFVVVVVCGCLAVVAASLSTAGHDLMIRDDWGSAAFGMLILSVAPYRPGRDLAAATAIAVVVIGFVVSFEVGTFSTQAPAIVFVTVGITPVAAFGVGGAVYASTFVRLVDNWMTRATSYTNESALELRPGIARSVQQDRVTILNRDVVPFFAQMIEQGEASDADRARAREIADSVRRTMVADADRSWMEQVVRDVFRGSTTTTVIDRSHLAGLMTVDQRTAIRALLVAMSQDQDARVATIGIVLHDDAPVVRALVRVEDRGHETLARQHYAPYFAVLRILFTDLQVDVTGPFLTLRFSYDQH